MPGEPAVDAATAGRARTVLKMAPPAAHQQTDHNDNETDGDRWMKRFLNGEYDRWMSVKRLLNVDQDHVIVKVLLDCFQTHGGFDEGSAGIEHSPTAGSLPAKGEPPLSDETSGQTEPVSPEYAGGDSPHPHTSDPDDPPSPPAEQSPPPVSNDKRRRLSGGRRSPNKARLSPSSPSPPPPTAPSQSPPVRPAPELPSVDPQLMPLFSCGLCGAGHFPTLADHFEHLWEVHTELQMLGNEQRRRVPLKLRPHMFVLCALCGLNNRSTSTAGAADRHLTRAHLAVRHRQELKVASAGSIRFECDVCAARFESRAQLAVHALDEGHACPGFVCIECGVEGEGAANERHHRLWHRAVEPFQCYLCAERFATEPNCVAHVQAEHAASFNVHQCARCRYATSTVAQFIAHARSHVGLNACVCHQCGVMFHTAASLRRHLMTHARSEFRCPHCDRSFRHPLPLERHVRSQHVSPEDHKCGACGKLFSSRYHLERHALIHSGRKPHQCHRCGRRFVQKGDLGRHVRTCRAGEPPVVQTAPPAQPATPAPVLLVSAAPPPLQRAVLIQPTPVSLVMSLPAQ